MVVVLVVVVVVVVVVLVVVVIVDLLKVFKVSPKQKKSTPGLSQRSTFFSEVKELENKGVGWCKCRFFQQHQIDLMVTILCFF